jgi:hypothetical protein
VVSTHVALSQYKRAADEQREREERQGKKKDIKGYGGMGGGREETKKGREGMRRGEERGGQ